jgi:hypothetical protein
MDEWHRRLALDLGSQPPADAGLTEAACLEIAFGRARSSAAYALELAIAHRVPATGSIAGDDVWFRLGEARARVTLNRRDGRLTISHPTADDVVLRWDEGLHALVQAQAPAGGGASAAPIDLEGLTRGAIDAVVADWLARSGKRLSAPPPTFEDEPTKA